MPELRHRVDRTLLLALLYIAWHAFRAARVVFGGSIPGTLVKFAGVAVYWTFVILATLGLLGYTFATL